MSLPEAKARRALLVQQIRLHAESPPDRAWRELIALRVEELKERMLDDTEHRDALANQARALRDLLSETRPLPRQDND